VFHGAGRDYTGPLVHTPWLQFRGATRLELFADGERIPCQRIRAEAPVNGLCKIVWQDTVPAGALKLYTLKEIPAAEGEAVCSNSVFPPAALDEIRLRLPGGETARVERERILVGETALSLVVYEDETDTWSHSAGNTFAGDSAGLFTWERAVVVDRGELFQSWACFGRFGNSRAVCELGHHAGEDMVRLRLRIDWSEIRKRLGLTVVVPGAIRGRTDLVSGGPLARPCDGREYPLAGMTCLNWPGGGVSLLAPGATSAGVRADRAVLTLLRSPYAAHHDPAPADGIPRPVLDQGTHEFAIAIRPGALAPAAMPAAMQNFRAPPAAWDVTG
jgi:hypothetical protein